MSFKSRLSCLEKNKKINKAKVIIMAGLPGSGKSTIAKELALKLKAEVISSDKIRKKLFNSSRFDSRGDDFVDPLKSKYYPLLFKKAKKLLLKEKKVIIDASNMNKERLKLIKKISSLVNKTKIVVLIVKTSEKMIGRRMKKLTGMATKKEDYYSAWKRVYGYFKDHLQQGSYFWPREKEGVVIIEVNND